MKETTFINLSSALAVALIVFMAYKMYGARVATKADGVIRYGTEYNAYQGAGY